jgi:DNA-binding transcriptional regulator GbsR (MarR family)
LKEEKLILQKKISEISGSLDIQQANETVLQQEIQKFKDKYKNLIKEMKESLSQEKIQSNEKTIKSKIASIKTLEQENKKLVKKIQELENNI